MRILPYHDPIGKYFLLHYFFPQDYSWWFYKQRAFCLHIVNFDNYRVFVEAREFLLIKKTLI